MAIEFKFGEGYAFKKWETLGKPIRKKSKKANN